MAQVDIDLRLNQGNVRQGLSQVQRQIGQTNGVLTSFLGNLAATAFTRFAGAAVDAFGDIFRSAIQIEQVGATFRVLIGDAQQAELALRSVSEFAAGTPFSNPEVERAAQQLLAFGTTAADLEGRLRDLGNIAGVTNRSIDQIATIFGQVNAQGRLTAERFNQLVEGGINLGDSLATRLMIPVTQLRDAISRGAVSADVFNEAISSLGDQFQGIDALANTLGGQLAQLGSTFELIRRDIGGRLNPIIQDLVRNFNAWLTSIRPVIQALTELVIDRVLSFFEDLRDAVNDASSTFNQIRRVIDENRGILIRIAAVYAIYTAAVVTSRLATLAWGIAVGLVNPILTVLRVGLLATRTAVLFLSGAFVRLAGFLATTFTAAVTFIGVPLLATAAILTALGVAGAGFSNELASAFVGAQRAGVQLAQAFTTVGIVIESVFREVAGSILEFIAPALQRVTSLISGLINRIPSAFRSASLDNFASSLDSLNFQMLARDIRTGESGLFAFNQELARSDMRLETLQNQLDMQASNVTFGEQLSTSFNDSLTQISDAVNQNEFLGPLVSQLGSFRMALTSSFDTGTIGTFVDSGRGLLMGLQEALVSGQIPTALQGVVGNIIGQVNSAIMNIEDMAARSDRNAAESSSATMMMQMQQQMAMNAMQIREEMRRVQMIANIRLTAMEQLAIMDEESSIAEIERNGIRDENDLNRISSHEQNIIDIRRSFAGMRAMNEMNSARQEIAIEQAQANQSVAIAKRAAEERMRLGMLEMRQSMGLAMARDQLLSAALASERLGARERKAILTAQAVINAYSGASRAFVDYPYPASLAVAAASVAAGLVQVDNIQNAGNFQQGGIIPGNSFSGDRLTANVNSGELILNRAQQDRIGSQLTQEQSLSVDMDRRLANIENILGRPTIIQNADGRMFAEIAREGIRDGVDING